MPDNELRDKIARQCATKVDAERYEIYKSEESYRPCVIRLIAAAQDAHAAGLREDAARLNKLARYPSFETNRKGTPEPFGYTWSILAYTGSEHDLRNWSGDGDSIRAAIDDLPESIDAAMQAEDGGESE